MRPVVNVEEYVRQVESGVVDPELRRAVAHWAWVGRMHVEFPQTSPEDVVGNVEGLPAWSEVS